MPANLTPQYLEAERKYKEARTDPEKLKALREMLATIPKHKGTEKLQADIKRRIARLKEETQKKGKGGKRRFSYYVDKEGAAQVVVVGPPNVGKSQLVTALTHATPEVADYPYTTRMFVPGMMTFENIQIQLVDLPPVSREFMESWLPEIIRHADAAMLLVDLSSEDPLEQAESTIEVLKDFRIILTKEEVDFDPYSTVTHLRTLLVGNKNDAPEAVNNWSALQEFYAEGFPMISISAKAGTNLAELKSHIFELLNILRIYSKPPGKEVDKSRPFIFKKGSTLLDFAEAIHQDFARQLKFARVWGKDKFDGQRINRDYALMDEDVIELHI